MLARPPVSAAHRLKISRAVIPLNHGGPHCGEVTALSTGTVMPLIPLSHGGPHCGTTIASCVDLAITSSRCTTAGLIAATGSVRRCGTSSVLIPLDHDGPHCGPIPSAVTRLLVATHPAEPRPHCGTAQSGTVMSSPN